MNITAKELSGEHLGKTITFENGGHEITVQLISVSHSARLIAEEKLCATEPMKFSMGKAFVSIGFHGHTDWPKAQLDADTPITIQEDQ